jgi:hypothetical protein
VVIKSTIFWDITRCSLLKVNRRFGGAYRLHLRGRKSRTLSLTHQFPAQHTLILLPVSFLDQQNCHISWPHKLVFLSPIGSLGGRVRSLAVSFCSTVSQRELSSSLPFPSDSLHNPKFPVSRLLCFPPAFMLVSFSAYSTLKMEMIRTSETSVDFQRSTRRYIPEESTLQLHKMIRRNRDRKSGSTLTWGSFLLYVTLYQETARTLQRNLIIFSFYRLHAFWRDPLLSEHRKL